MKRELFFEPSGRQAGYTISRRRVFKLLSGIIAYGTLVSIPGVAAWAQVPTNPSDSIQGSAIALKEQAVRWLSTNGAQDLAYDWVDLVWMWGEAVGIRPDLMLAQEMLETGWGRFQGIVAPEYHNVAGIKVRDPSDADLPEDFERFDSWSEGIRAHANHLAAYCGAAPVLGPNEEPVHDRYYVVASLPWAGSVKTTDGLSGTWSTRDDYAQTLHETCLDSLRSI